MGSSLPPSSLFSPLSFSSPLKMMFPLSLTLSRGLLAPMVIVASSITASMYDWR